MRLRGLVKGDLRFIYKYGLAFIYIIFTVLYILILEIIKGDAKTVTGSILIYTDPAAMGLFFMGAFIMLEKSQRINCSLAVSPITVTEYIISKAVSLMIPGTVVGAILSLFAGNYNLFAVIPAVIISSFLFSLCGLIAAVKSESLNGFMIAVIPFEIIISLPAILYVLDVLSSELWLIHPGVAAMHMISGNVALWYFCVPSMLFWTILVFIICKKAITTYFTGLGGGKIV